MFEVSSTHHDFKGIVFASYNYRLSLFGYPHAAEIAEAGETQNFGLLDTRAAVEWLRDNVAKFGGDPSKITLGGDSYMFNVCLRFLLTVFFSGESVGAGTLPIILRVTYRSIHPRFQK